MRFEFGDKFVDDKGVVIVVTCTIPHDKLYVVRRGDEEEVMSEKTLEGFERIYT